MRQTCVYLVIFLLIHCAISQVSIFKPHNYDSSGFVPIFVKPMAAYKPKPEIVRHSSANARMDNIHKLVNPFDTYEPATQPR